MHHRWKEGRYFILGGTAVVSGLTDSNEMTGHTVLAAPPMYVLSAADCAVHSSKSAARFQISPRNLQSTSFCFRRIKNLRAV